VTDEEINRKFDVVANLMADVAVSLGQLGAKVDALAEAQHRADERLARTEGSIRALLAAAEIQASEIALQSGQIKDLSAAVQAVDERQHNMDERLNALISVVERLMSDRTGPA
jgi:DNA repair exonuclease SbcCD ATPase subunit